MNQSTIYARAARLAAFRLRQNLLREAEQAERRALATSDPERQRRCREAARRLREEAEHG